MNKTPARSYLFVPGHRPDRFDKACATGADVVIIDLEDAVAPSGKVSARESVRAWLAAVRPASAAAIAVRINAFDTEWFEADVAMCAGMRVPSVVLPKSESAAQLDRIAAAYIAMHASDHSAVTLLPLIESAQGFAAAQAIASYPGVERLIFGSIDFQVDMGISGDGEELLYFRSQLVLASRLAGVLAPVDGVSTAIDDTNAVHAETLRGRRLGFGAKLCIHPRQVATVNAAFAPTEHEIVWARRVLEVAATSNGAAVALDGKMVDRPVILKAEAILRLV
jgi:citrate lyase subunit beta/citryl-CoA lyase